jgi:peptide/nickel transport system substrate-binding protein
MGRPHVNVILILVAVLLLAVPIAPLGAQARLVPMPELTFTFPTFTYDPIRYEASLMIVSNLQKLGMTVRLIPMDFTALTQRISTPPWDFNLFVSGYVSRPERLDPDVLLYRPFFGAFTGEGGSNYQGYKSAEFDKVVEAQRQEMDIDKRRDLVFKAQEILAREVPAIALYHIREVHVFNKTRFKDFKPMTGQGNWNYWSLISADPLTSERLLKVGRTADIDSVNPLVEGGGAGIEIMRLIYDMLARVGLDGKPTPSAAEKWEVVNPTTIRVTLRAGMRFHDGRPVTADDVKFSYDFIKQWRIPIYRPFLDPIASIEVTDPRTLVFRLNDPYPPLFQATFAQIYILPKHIWEDVTRREGVSNPVDWRNPNAIGSGPFKFVHWRRGEEVKLARNETYYRAPKAEGMIQVAFANPDALFAALMKGEMDMHDRRLLPNQIPEAKTARHLGMIEKPDFGVYYVAFNSRKAPFDDVRFRQAVAHAVPRERMVEVLLKGYGEPGRGFIAPANEFWHNPKQTEYPFDLDKARALLRQAGYNWDPQGRLLMPSR